MDRVFKISVSDGAEIYVDGSDDISFFNEIPNSVVTKQAYTWQNSHYHELMNNLSKYNFISLKRNDPQHKLEYRDHSFAFKNKEFEENESLYLQTKCITTIIRLY